MTTQATISRTADQVRHHYEVEKELAERLRAAGRDERRRMYSQVYNELYSRVKDHPLLQRKALGEDELRKLAAIRTQLRFLQRFLRPTTVFLEVGSGSCLVSMRVARQVKQVIAVDVSHEISQRRDLPSNLDLRIFNGVDVPAEPGTVDIAYSHQVMEHVHPDDVVDQVRSIHRALAPGGAYVCVVPNRINGPHDISKDFDEVATGFHMKEYTTTELMSLFRSVGFKRFRFYVGAKGIYFPVPKWTLAALEHCLDRLTFSMRAAIGRRAPVRMLLELRMAGWK